MPLEGKMDLHELCQKYGTEAVANVMGMTERCLIDIRRGHTAMTVDDFFELERTYLEFDVVKTIRRIGRGREHRQSSRKFRKRKGAADG